MRMSGSMVSVEVMCGVRSFSFSGVIRKWVTTTSCSCGRSRQVMALVFSNSSDDGHLSDIPGEKTYIISTFVITSSVFNAGTTKMR